MMIRMEMDAYVTHHREAMEAHRRACRAAREEVLRRLAGIEGACRRFDSLERVYVFGSVLTDRFSPGSDLDMAVSGVTGREFFALWAALEEALGRAVDLTDLDVQRVEFCEAVTSRGRCVYEKR